MVGFDVTDITPERAALGLAAFLFVLIIAWAWSRP